MNRLSKKLKGILLTTSVAGPAVLAIPLAPLRDEQVELGAPVGAADVEAGTAARAGAHLFVDAVSVFCFRAQTFYADGEDGRRLKKKQKIRR